MLLFPLFNSLEVGMWSGMGIHSCPSDYLGILHPVPPLSYSESCTVQAADGSPHSSLLSGHGES